MSQNQYFCVDLARSYSFTTIEFSDLGVRTSDGFSQDNACDYKMVSTAAAL